MERQHTLDARDAIGQLISEYYCPRCDYYSGGGLCRVCQREITVEGANAAPDDDSSTVTPNNTCLQSLCRDLPRFNLDRRRHRYISCHTTSSQPF